MTSAAAERRLESRLAGGESELAILAADDLWETLYHLAPHRRSLLEWYPFPADGAVLERFAEGGALTGLLLERSRQVTAVEPDPDRAALLKRRHGANPALELRHALPGRDRRYETIVVVASALTPEVAGSIPGEIAGLAPRLAPGGRLLVGLPGVPSPALAAALAAAGLRTESTLYPTPDLWLPHELFSDALPPGRGAFPLPPPRFDTPSVRPSSERARLGRVAAAGAFAATAPATLLVLART